MQELTNLRLEVVVYIHVMCSALYNSTRFGNNLSFRRS
jgi:hypothetical protein